MYKTYCEFRDKRKLTDAEVSRRTGIPKSTFVAWKQHSEGVAGGYEPKLDKLLKIADCLKISVNTLIKEKKETT